jgi:hypothetical protein
MNSNAMALWFPYGWRIFESISLVEMEQNSNGNVKGLSTRDD